MKIQIHCDEADQGKVCGAMDSFNEEVLEALQKKFMFKVAKKLGKEFMFRAAVNLSYEKNKDGVLVEIPLMIPIEVKVFGKKLEAKKLKSLMVENIRGYLTDKGIGKFEMEGFEK